MKRIISILFAITVSMVALAQKDVTKFMGIPVDGTISEMKAKLKAKGFKEANYGIENQLVGRFNDTDVLVMPMENNGKVYRVCVTNLNPYSETDVRIAYNNLCYQFCRNSKYSPLKEEKEYMIPDTEDISYEITVNNKNYEAPFIQLDSISAQKIINDALYSRFTEEEIQHPTPEQRKEMREFGVKSLEEISRNKFVWFRIGQISYGRYIIPLYYDNGYNKNNGEDL